MSIINKIWVFTHKYKLEITWLLITVALAYNYAYLVYPRFQAKLNNRLVTIYKQLRDPNNGNVIYEINTPNNKDVINKYLNDDKRLYFSRCELLPLSEQIKCDGCCNWTGVSPLEIGCSDVITCQKEDLIVPNWLFLNQFSNINTKSKSAVQLENRPINSNDPASWGDIGKFPLFLIFIFLGIKFGLALKNYFQR